MASAPANVRRHFLPWNRPLLPAAAAWLAGAWHGDGPLDLSDTLVVVPTRQSGRRLREALADYAAARGSAVFPPRVLTPEILVNETLPASGVATRLETLLAWAEVCAALPLAEFRAVFPLDPPARNFAWALRLAQTFARLQTMLAEGGLRIADVGARAGADCPETDRWRELASLERRYDAALAARVLRDEQAAKIAAASRVPLSPAIARVVVLAAPDPLALAVSVLAAHAEERPVDIVVFAPETEAANFDAWGRPIPSVWEQRALDLPDFFHRTHLCADPAAQAERIAEAAQRYERPDGLLAIGVADPEIAPPLVRALAHAGLAAFDPEGHARTEEPLFHLLAALAAFARAPTFDAVARLARCPDMLAWLATDDAGEAGPADFLAALDALHARHLPADLAAARAHAADAFAAALDQLATLHTTLTTGAFPDNAAAALAMIFARRRLDTAREADARFEQSAKAWMEIVRDCARAMEKFPAPATADGWALALALFAESRERGAPKPDGALELHGVLELLFEDAPHLIVAGANDGRLPEGVVVGDAFLPEALRTRLGLKTNATRFARDAYVLAALAHCRPRLDLLVGKTSAAGDPLRPSRLLLRCADAELPARVRHLFREAEAPRPSAPWARAWRLRAPRRAAPARVAVTALRQWLDCPFRFYLRHVLRMRPIDPFKSELDARDFGELVHRALAALGRDETRRDCADADELRAFLLGEFDRHARARYGAEVSLPLLIQLESARQRLAKAAEIEAASRADGWRTIAVEKKFELEISGLTVVGQMDRIDRHAVTGAVRVLDYKTSDRAVAPAEAHTRAPRGDEPPPEWTLAPTDGKKTRMWADLQLPLYERALAAEFGAGVTCGYFNLPKAVGETAIAAWEGFTIETRASAWLAAETICAEIRAGHFWPPRELTARDAEHDDFAALFHEGAAASIAWEDAP
ncbi:MAG: ATP-dependent helicase/deoxyribonuclease subunit [Verrucomicrobiota bacterium]